MHMWNGWSITLRRARIACAIVLITGGAVVGAQEASGGTSGNAALIAAYQREFVFLDNEIRILEERLAEVNASGESRVSAAQSRLEALERTLIELRNDVDRRQEDLRLLEEEAADTRSADDGVERIVEQAGQRLEDFSVIITDDSSEDRTAELSAIFSASFDVLENASRIRSTPGSFFLEDGRETSGELVRIGRIAAFGLSDDNGGTLAPAGDGFFKLVDRETFPVARRLAEGPVGVGEAATLPLFIFDSLSDPADIGEGGSFRETVEASGIIGMVIIAIGIVALLLVVLRVLSLIAVGRGKKSGALTVARLIKEGDFDGAYRAAVNVPGALGRVLAVTVSGLQRGGEGIEDAISESVLNEQPALDRFRSALAVFAAVAPLLGLLGTVTGMITTFDVITQFGTGDPKLLSGGISEALITTEFGLAVAIPTLLVGNLLSSWSDRITSDIEISALRLVNIVGGYESTSLRQERA